MTWDPRLVPFPFRLDAGDDPGVRWVTAGLPAFERLRRIHEMNAHLELVRAHLGDAWWGDDHGADTARDYAPLLVQVLQKLSETNDFFRTVDFVDERVLRQIVDARTDLFADVAYPRAGTREDLWPRHARGRVHEHMVPTACLRRILRGTHRERTGIGRADLEAGGTYGGPDARTALLWHLCYRALIAEPASRRSDLPESIARIGPDGEREVVPLRALPIVFLPLARYHACGLVDALVPVNERARRLVASFARWLDTGEVVLPAIAAEGEAARVPRPVLDEIDRVARRMQALPGRRFAARRATSVA
jgi:hypothetical protein